jgi:NAD(P)-dependent dehydrogenase (short-subunit alcohol dehydrogenase family)
MNSSGKRYPHPHRFSVVDVTDDRQVAQWAAHVLQTVGVPDLLICNAAVMNTPAPLWEIGAKEFDSLIDTNIKGVANTIRHFVPTMVAAGSGIVVTLSSGWGTSASPNVAPYCASKFAIEGLTKALSQELPKGMAAIAVSPGVIATDMLTQAFGADASKHQGTEEWVKKAVPFFLKLTVKDIGKSLRIAA